jgi:RHS repeat-associated protein
LLGQLIAPIKAYAVDDIIPPEAYWSPDNPAAPKFPKPQPVCNYVLGIYSFFLYGRTAHCDFTTALSFDAILTSDPTRPGAPMPETYPGYSANPICTSPYIFNGMDLKCHGERPPPTDPNTKKNAGPCCQESGGSNSISGGTNPINVLTGNKFQVETDYSGTGAFPLVFQRTYNSSIDLATGTGSHWRDNYARILTVDNDAAPTVVFSYRPDGRMTIYRLQGGSFVADGDINERLVRSVNGSGVTTAWTLTTATDEKEVYTPTGQLLSITNRAGVTQTLTYSTALTSPTIAPVPDLLIQVTHSFGQTLSFIYDDRSRIKTLVAPDGGQYQYEYDPYTNLTLVTYPDATVRQYVYNEPELTGFANLPHALTGLIDENTDRFASWGYDSTGRAISSEHAGGVDRYDVSYAAGVSTVTDPLSAARTFTSGVVLGVVKNTGVSQPCAQYCGDAAASYNTNGSVTSKTDFNGVVTTYGYDTARNLETTRNDAVGTPKARTITNAWHSTFRIPTSVTEPNRTTSFTHDAHGNVLTRTVTDTSIIPNVTRTWTYTYNSFGQVLTVNGPRTDVSDITTYTYYTCTTGSQCGQVQTVQNAASQVTTYNSYNTRGQPTQITDPNGLVTTIAYDARQRLADRCVGATLPSCTSGELTHLDYWPTGLLKKVTNPDASYIQYTYDAAHRLIQINDGASNKIVYALDNAGNRTAENSYDPSLNLKRTHTRVFNTLNQLWKDVNAAGTVNVTTVFGYDSNGNQTTTNAPLSRNSTNLYDELNRLKQITDPNSGVTQFGYDSNDNLTSVTDPRTLATTYTYTGFGDLKTQTSPDTGLTTNTYDSGGNLKTSTDARSAITTYTYDVLNRVSSAAYKIGATTDQTITYTYDAGPNGKGHLTGAGASDAGANHSLSWSYDAKGRVTGKGQLVNGLTTAQSIGYGYNSAGQLASIVLPSGKTIAYGYNTNGQVVSVTLNGSPNVTILNNVTYDPFGPVTGWTWGNGTALTSRTFDTDGKLTALSNTPATTGNRTFGFDNAFRITSTTDSATGGPAWTLGYDILDRLNSATKTGTTIGYTYDADGNRLTQTGSSASTYSIPATSNKLSSTAGALVRTYNYDLAGNVLNSGATTHTYYNNGRMKTGKLGAAAVTTYIYNALGQRVKKSGGAATTTVYMYDEAGHLVGEYTISSGVAVRVQETVWLGDIPIATLRTNGANVDVFYVHTDQLNMPRKVTVSTGTNANKLRWSWDPTPFGEGAPNENPSIPALGVFQYNLRFPGQYFDLETNLNYNYFRDYDPAIGRYTKSDPIGLHGGVNTYAYVQNDPIRKIDPKGLIPGPHTGPKQPCPPDQPNCKAVKEKCIAQCSEGLPTTDYGFQFWNCVNKCMAEEGCEPDGTPTPIAPPIRSPVRAPKPSRPPIVPILVPRMPSFLPPMIDPCVLMYTPEMCGPPPPEA